MTSFLRGAPPRKKNPGIRPCYYYLNDYRNSHWQDQPRHLCIFLRSVTEPCRLNFSHYIWSKTNLRFFNLLSRTKGQIKVKQRSYLEAKFSIGQATGRKLDADIVAKEMRHALGSDERRLFKSSELQTEQQITAYFSRLSTKVRQQAETTEEDIWAIFS